jgi:hypothetical protein
MNTVSMKQNTRVVARVWQEIVSNGDLGPVDELLAEDYIYRGPGGREVRGPEGFRRYKEDKR